MDDVATVFASFCACCVCGYCNTNTNGEVHRRGNKTTPLLRKDNLPQTEGIGNSPIGGTA